MFSLAISTACGDPESKSKRTEANSADAIDDKEDIVAERPAVISGSHLFCSEEPGLMGEDHVDVVCSIKEDIDFEKYVDKDYLVIEVAGKVVPITIDDNGKFKFTLPKDQEFSTEGIEVHDTEKSESDPEVLANSDDSMDESQKSESEGESQTSESSENGNDGESETDEENLEDIEDEEGGLLD